MKVLILTEGGKNSGFGHVTRCVSLFQEFKKRDIYVKMFVSGDETIKGLVKDTNHRILDWLDKREETLKAIDTSDIIIVDSYIASRTFYKELYKFKKTIFVVAIDDYNRLDYCANIVLNPSICTVREMGYKKHKKIKYLVGRDYILLRKDFFGDLAKEIKENVKDILITLGGVDFSSFMAKLVNSLPRDVFHFHIISKDREVLNHVEKGMGSLYSVVTAKNMINLMIKADLCISGSGQTLYELARVGVPTISIKIADNQTNNIKGLKKVGFIEHAGSWNDKYIFRNVNKAVKKLNNQKLRKSRSQIGKKVVDGNGSNRIVEDILKRYKNENPFSLQ